MLKWGYVTKQHSSLNVHSKSGYQAIRNLKPLPRVFQQLSVQLMHQYLVMFKISILQK